MPRKTPSRPGKGTGESDLLHTPASELSRHLVRAQEEERKRISRELHDETGQGLMVLRMYLEMLDAECPNQAAQQKVHDATVLIDQTIEGLRRIIGRLSPRLLEELGLLAAIRREIRELGRNTGIKPSVSLPAEVQGIDRESEIGIYRTVQEALYNIARHSQARTARVEMEHREDQILLVIEDDGVGIARQRGGNRTFGLLGMRDRIVALGGTVRIRSVRGKGTRIEVILPVRLEERAAKTGSGT